ncbi:MAG: HEAT repeat domain-containing protein [Deltaproteobacteria bacterium]|nr:HEAT repeat domain-containing protein [Deltaproteobacteria bacterium]
MRKLSIPLIIGALMLSAWSASAQIGKREVKDAIYKLQSPNPEEVLSSVQLLAASGSNSAVAPLTDLLRSGPRNDITNAAIQALGSIGHKTSIAILIEYLDHRRPDARTASIYALEQFSDPKVHGALENKLRDSDKQVRNAAALALGKRGNKAAVPILFQAFDRGVNDAAVAIGQIGAPADAQRMTSYLGKADIEILLPGFWEFLTRAKFPTKAKIEILEQLFELAGPDVRRFAVAYKATFPPGTEEDENALFKMVSRMVRQIAEK